MNKIFVAALIVFYSLAARANVLNEGWFEVYLGANKIGYMVERYEFTGNKFKAVTYLKIVNGGITTVESLKAFAKNDLAPLNYSYTLKDGDSLKAIDATFSGTKLNLKINDGAKQSKETKVIKKGTFLSTFLVYMILAQKDGLTAGKDFSYNAVAEEDGKAYTGNAKVTTLDKVKGKDAYKVLNKFKGESFFSWVTPKGDFLLTRNPDKNLEVRQSTDMKIATEGLGVNLADLKLLFGSVPGVKAEAVEEKKPKQTKPETEKLPAKEPVAKPKIKPTATPTTTP